MVEVKKEVMTYKQKKEYLNSYKDKCDRLEFVKNQIEGIQAIKYTPSINGPKKSKSAYMDEKSILESEINHIERSIDEIENEKSRFVLKYRFIEGIKLEDIASWMSYSQSQIYRYYKKGLEDIQL